MLATSLALSQQWRQPLEDPYPSNYINYMFRKKSTILHCSNMIMLSVSSSDHLELPRKSMLNTDLCTITCQFKPVICQYHRINKVGLSSCCCFVFIHLFNFFDFAVLRQIQWEPTEWEMMSWENCPMQN